MKLEDVKHHCPRCGAELTLVIWGCMWDWDTAECPKCGYDGELDTMTGVDPDGSIWQTAKPEEDE